MLFTTSSTATRRPLDLMCLHGLSVMSSWHKARPRHGPWIRWLALSHLKVVLSWLNLYCIFPFVNGPDHDRLRDHVISGHMVITKVWVSD